jgi:hypothetical protein
MMEDGVVRRPPQAGRVRGATDISLISFHFCTPHPPLRGTLSLRERDRNIVKEEPFEWIST